MKYTLDDIHSRLANVGKSHIVALSEVDNQKHKVHLYCTIHKIDYYQSLDDAIHKKYGCPECVKDGKHKTVLLKHNLLIDKPEIAAMLKYPEKACMISTYSKQKEWFVCPHCGTDLYKSVFNVVQNGLKCNVCSDGFSYPNKLMFHILQNIGIVFESEFCPEWINYSRYDFMFHHMGKMYIVEMDGGLGHGKKSFGNNEELSISKNKDDYKDEIAIKNGYIVIRINADKSELSYIKNNIYHSILSEIFDLNAVNWEYCDEKSQSSMLVDVCNYYSLNKSSISELADYFCIAKDTVEKYLKKGYALGLNPKYQPHHYGKKVLCLESNIIFDSCRKAASFYKLDASIIRRVCIHERNSTGNLHFMYLDEYDGDVDLLIPNYDIVADSSINKVHAKPVIIVDTQINDIMDFKSIYEVTKYFDKQDTVIKRYIDADKLYQNRYILKYKYNIA